VNGVPQAKPFQRLSISSAEPPNLASGALKCNGATDPIAPPAGMLPQQFMPPFSLAPTPVMPPGLSAPAGGQQGYSPFLRTPVSGGAPHLPAGATTAPGGTASGSQTQQQQAGGAPQMFAPTLAYVPVNLVSPPPPSFHLSPHVGGEEGCLAGLRYAGLS